MKICWDNLENLKYSNNTGKWYSNNYYKTYTYKEECKCCNEPFLTSNNGIFCNRSCSNKKKYNPMYGKLGKNHPLYGENHPYYNTKRPEHSKWMIENNPARFLNKTKINNPNWKGGYNLKNIPTYDIYASQINWCEKVRRNKIDKNILEVKCTYCGNGISQN